MKKILSLIAAAILSISVFATPIPAMAEEDKTKNNGVETAILTDCGQDEDGVACILNLIVDVLSIGIGILGVIGITIVGIQYLTAGGDEGKTRKAKQRMFEIIIGLVAYVVIYAILKWLLPSFDGV